MDEHGKIFMASEPEPQGKYGVTNMRSESYGRERIRELKKEEQRLLEGSFSQGDADRQQEINEEIENVSKMTGVNPSSVEVEGFVPGENTPDQEEESYNTSPVQKGLQSSLEESGTEPKQAGPKNPDIDRPTDFEEAAEQSKYGIVNTKRLRLNQKEEQLREARERIKSADKDARFKVGGETISRNEALSRIDEGVEIIRENRASISRRRNIRTEYEQVGRKELRRRRRETTRKETGERQGFNPLSDAYSGMVEHTSDILEQSFLDDDPGGFGEETRELGREIREAGMGLMQYGQQLSKPVEETTEDVIPEWYQGSYATMAIGLPPKEVVVGTTSGIATAGTQAAGFFTAGAGSLTILGGEAVEGKEEAANTYREFGEGVRKFGEETKEQVVENPAKFASEETGEEISEAVIGYLAFGGAGAVAGAMPTPEIEPEVEPEPEPEPGKGFDGTIEVEQGEDMPRLDSRSVEVDEEGNIITGVEGEPRGELIGRTGETRGVKFGDKTVYGSEQPFLTGIVKNTEGKIEDVFVGRVESGGTIEQGEAEGIARVDTVRLDEEMTPQEAASKIVDFEAEEEGSMTENIFTETGERTRRIQDVEAVFSGRAGETEFEGLTFQLRDVREGEGEIFEAETGEIDESVSTGIRVETRGGFVEKEFLEQFDVDKKVDIDEMMGEGDSTTRSLEDLSPDEIRVLREDARDIFGTDFQNFMDSLEKKAGRTEKDGSLPGSEVESGSGKTQIDSSQEFQGRSGVGMDEVNVAAFKDVIKSEVEPDTTIEPETEVTPFQRLEPGFKEENKEENRQEQAPVDIQVPEIGVEQEQVEVPELERVLETEMEPVQEVEITPQMFPEPEPEPEPTPGLFGGDERRGEPENGEELFGVSTGEEFSPSLGGLFLGATAEEAPEKVSGIGIRPLVIDQDNR